MAFKAQTWRGWSPSRSNSERAARRRSQFFGRLDQSVYSTVALGFLVALFIIAAMSQPRAQVGMAVSLAAVRHPAWEPNAIRDDSMHLQVFRDGVFYFGTTKVMPDDLPALIRASVRGGAERKIYLYVDSRAQYGNVKKVLDEIHAAGITNVSFIVYASSSSR
jgi:biopolymer transport protein ExbD